MNAKIALFFISTALLAGSAHAQRSDRSDVLLEGLRQAARGTDARAAVETWFTENVVALAETVSPAASREFKPEDLRSAEERQARRVALLGQADRLTLHETGRSFFQKLKPYTSPIIVVGIAQLLRESAGEGVITQIASDLVTRVRNSTEASYPARVAIDALAEFHSPAADRGLLALAEALVTKHTGDAFASSQVNAIVDKLSKRPRPVFDPNDLRARVEATPKFPIGYLSLREVLLQLSVTHTPRPVPLDHLAWVTRTSQFFPRHLAFQAMATVAPQERAAAQGFLIRNLRLAPAEPAILRSLAAVADMEGWKALHEFVEKGAADPIVGTTVVFGSENRPAEVDRAQMDKVNQARLEAFALLLDRPGVGGNEAFVRQLFERGTDLPEGAVARVLERIGDSRKVPGVELCNDLASNLLFTRPGTASRAVEALAGLQRGTEAESERLRAAEAAGAHGTETIEGAGFRLTVHYDFRKADPSEVTVAADAARTGSAAGLHRLEREILSVLEAPGSEETHLKAVRELGALISGSPAALLSAQVYRFEIDVTGELVAIASDVQRNRSVRLAALDLLERPAHEGLVSLEAGRRLVESFGGLNADSDVRSRLGRIAEAVTRASTGFGFGRAVHRLADPDAGRRVDDPKAPRSDKAPGRPTSRPKDARRKK